MFRKQHHTPIIIIVSLMVGLVALALPSILPTVTADTAQLTARQEVAQAIDQAGDSGQYRYQTTVVQTHYPTLLLENVGRSARVETIELNGTVDVPADSMMLQMKAPNSPELQIRIEEGRGYGRLTAEDEWTEVELATDLFAPGGDPMGFLASAENIRLAEGLLTDSVFPTELLPVSLTSNISRYQFDVNGQEYATALRVQLTEQLVRNGELPAGVTLEIAQHYAGMTGRGEIWIHQGDNGRSLPIRQIVQLDFPAQTGATEWVSAKITTSFSNWSEPQQDMLAATWQDNPVGALSTFVGTFLENSAGVLRQVSFAVGATLLGVGGIVLFAVYGRRREFQAALNLIIVTTMITAPLLQAQQASAQSEQIADFNARQLALQEEITQVAQESEASQDTTFSPLAQQAEMVALTSSCVITATSDCDGDGLTDNVERYEIGTNIEKADTDGDGISDGREVTPYEWFGTWYLDPLKMDTNGDGIDDGAECFNRVDMINGVVIETLDMPCFDRDLDEIPDVHDYDNDGDGVPDTIDLNPNDSQVVTNNEFFKLDLVDAQADTNIVVDLQIRPLNEQHLWWTNNILDWPDADNLGQHQRMTPNTLGNGDGDIQLMPMLEITIPYSPANPAGGLPVSGTPTITATTPISTWLDTTVTDQYAMIVRLGPNGERIANLPLIEITDPTGGGPVGWQARIPYRLQTAVTDWGNPHEMRVVWFVNGQQDSCSPPANAAADYCTDSANWTSTTTLLQTYPETFRITGLTVSEHHGATALLAGQTPGSGNANYENELWHLADVLQKTWLEGQTVSSVRFPLRDVDTTLGAWGISNVPTSESDNLTDEVALFNAVDLTAVTNFINTSLYPSAPADGTTTTVLLAGEESYRTIYLGTLEQVDIGGVPTVITRTLFADSVMTVDFTGKSVTANGMLRWQPYEYSNASWQPADLGTYADQLGVRLNQVFTNPVLESYQLIPPGATDTAEERAGAVMLAQNYYLATAAGVNAPLQAPVPEELSPSYPLPTETAVAIVYALASKVQNTFSLLNLNGQTFPTVESGVDTQGTAAWNALALSVVTVVKGYGQLATGSNSSAISQALTELAYLPRISIEQGSYEYLTDASLIFANEQTRAQLGGLGSGTIASVLVTIYPLATATIASYGHLSYAAQASVQNLRTNILTALDAHVASEVAGLNSRMVELHDEMLAIQAEIDDLANVEKIPDKPKKLPASEVEISKLKYKQNGRIAINFYLQNDDEAIYQAAKALGVKSDLLSGNVAVRYTDLQRDLVSLDSQLNTVIDLVNDEEARVKRSFFSTTNVDPADLVPSHALKAQQVAKRWAVAGVAISAASAGLTIALALANGRFQPDSPQFSRFLAEQIAAVIVDVFIAVLDVLVVVGSVAVLGVVLAVIAVLDGVISVVCAVTGYAETNPTAASWICGGISGALAKVLSYVINDTTPLVDLARTDRLAISFDTPLLGSETGVTGLVAGNSITLTGKVTTTLYMDYPNWMGHLSFWQWNDNNLDDATFEYQLQASQQDIPLDLNGTSWIPVPEKTPTPVRAEDARFYQQIPIQSYNHTFAQPGINQGLPVYLAEGFATHQQNCWIIPFVCWLSEYDDTIHQPLENSFVFDVWPTSIDELVALTLQPDSNNNNGYRLAWDTTFPTLADADGDGLRSQAMNGPDPDDSNPDSDADGLPDSYELATAGFDPTLSDTDCDGLTDYWEAFYGTNPARPDTDGDGLTDNEEHLHANQNYPYDSTELVNVSPPLCSAEKTTYSGGWLVVYDYDSNGDPLMAQVSADPLDPDSDDDTLSDKQERIYAYNPNVASSLNVLSLDTTIASTNSQLPYVSPSSVISYTAVITNELTLPYARGLVETELPLDNVLRYQSTEAIPPQSTVTVTGSVGLAEAGLTSTGPVNMGIRAGAIIEDPTGRVLWLHMNELAGSSTFADASFLQNDGVCAGANCPTANGQQLTFDGNDTISIPDSADLIGTNYSIAMAVRPTSSGAQGVLFSKTDAVSANGTLSLVLNSDNTVSFNNTDYCGTPSGNFLTSSNSLPVNQWSHIVATLDGAIKRLYINGIEVASISYPRAGECVNTRQVAIGAFIHNGSPTSGFVGQMDEVEVYPEALGANTIADRYATPLLQVDLRNATTWGSDDVSCSGVACPTVGSGGAAFSQVDHLVATAPDLTGDAFAFATWIRPQARTYPMSNDSATAFGKWTDADYQGVFGYQSTFGSDEVFPSLFVGDNGRLRMIWGDGTTTCEVASANTGILTFDNTWQHLVVNYDGSNLTFFVNGEPIPGGTTGSCATVTPPSVSNFYIGRPNNFGYLYFDKATFENFSDTRGTGQSAEMRLNLNSDSSSGNLVWQNNLANDTTTLWTVNKTAVINDSNAWFRVWENNDGGCFISCPEDDSTDTNFDQDWGHTDTSLLHVTGINSTTYLGEQSSRVRTDYCGTICLPTMWGMLDWSNYNDFFKGTLDDFRVYGNALTPAAIADMFRATSMALDLPFDEAPGSDVFGDQSGNAISVSCSGTTCPTSGVPGRFNQALSFDGVDDFLTIGTSSTVLGTSESSFTAMMWIKPDTFWGTGDFGNVPLVEVGNNYDLGLRGYGRLAASSGSFTAWTSNYTLYNATGRWYHLAYVFENGQYTFYVNGVNVGSDWLEAPGTAEILRIGRNSNNLYFDGLLDDLTIVKRALTVAEVQAHFNRAPGINLHLDEGLKTDNGIIINQTITTFRDDSESRYMATCADANTCPDAGDKGQMRESVTFDGNDLLTLSGTSTMVLTDFSVGMWVKPTATSTTNQWLATKSTTSFTSANFRLSLLVNSLTVRFDRETSCGSDSWQSVDADNPLIANQWNHVLATHDATNGEMKIYVNGRLAGITSSIGSSLCTNSSPIRLGQEYDGGMDEVAITPSVLDAEAVGALYNYQAAWYDLFNPYALFVDADLPTVDLSLTPETVGAAQTVLFIGADDATSSVAMVEYRIDGGSWQEATSGNQQGANSSAWLYVFQEVGGTHTIEARATDVAGNVSAIASASILVDTQGPSLTIDNSPAAVQVVDSLPLIGTVSDTGSGVSANGVTVGLSDWNGDAVGGNLVATIDESGDWSAFQTFETEPYGRYTVTAVTQDETGNQTTTTATVSLDNLPPYASVTDDGNYVAPSVVKTISGVASELPYPADSRTLHLHFESGDGLWVDGSKTQFTMLCSGATCPTSGTPGKFGEAITFDGVDDYLMLGGNEAITTSVSAGQLGLLDGSFTIMGWVNGSDWSGDHAVLGSTPITTTAGFYAGIRDGRPILGYSGDDTVVTNTIATDEWVHVVWRYDAATGERAFFVNGVETAVSANHNPYDIGDDIDIEVGRAQGGNPFGGSLDELVVFAQALDAETIYDIANPVNATISNLQLRVRSYDQRDIGQYAGTWTAVTLDNPNALYTTWQYALPTTLAEGGYKIDLRVTDSSGNIAFMEGVWDLAVVAPDLVVTKQTSATIVELNDILQYTITYNNTSIVDAPNVTLSEIVPVDTSFNAGLSHPNWVCADGGAAGSQCTLSLGELPVGASGSISFTVTVTDTWSPGTSAIINTTTIESSAGDANSVDNAGTAQTPINGIIDLELTISQDTTPYQLDDPNFTKVYTFTYANIGTLAATGVITVPLTEYNQIDYGIHPGWTCTFWPFWGCIRELGTVASGETGFVTLTMQATSGIIYDPNEPAFLSGIIGDAAGGTEINTTNNSYTVTTPFETRYTVVLSPTAATIQEGQVITHTGVLTGSDGGTTITLETVDLVGQFYGHDSNTDLDWGWVYTSTDGPGDSQMIRYEVIVGGEAYSLFGTFPLTVVDVAPSVPITGSNSVATGVQYDLKLGAVFDPGDDTVTACSIDWGDGNSDACPINPTGHVASHTYGNVLGFPTITVYLTDEDGTHVAATKAVTVLGVSASVDSDLSSVSAYESITVTNSGTYSPPDATYSWLASEGTVVDEGNGVWSWSLPPGSAEGSRTVTVYADDLQTSFTINVQGDGAATALENGAPNGGDGNNDGTPDSAQMHVASLPSPITGQYVTIAATLGMTLTNVAFTATPSAGAGSLPTLTEFPMGFPSFDLSGMGVGGSADVTMIFTSTADINSYYKYDAVNGWYPFEYDTATDTGAELVGNSVSLYLVDGARGDSDLSANGSISDPGGPAFKLPTYDLTVTTQGGGSVSVPSGSYLAGTVLTLEVTETEQWGFVGWQGALSGSLISQTLTMDRDQSVIAVFVENEYTLDLRVVGNGRLTNTPSQTSYTYNDVVSLLATADPGWGFSGWSGDIIGSNIAESVVITGNLVITGTFTQETYTVTSSTDGNGSIRLIPDQASYVYGDDLLVEAVPNPGYELANWSGDLTGDGASRTLLIDGDQAITAHFVPASYTVITTTEGSGSIVIDPVKTTYSYGDVISVTAVPDQDWQFADWELGLSGSTETQSLTITGNTNLRAIFEPVAYSLSTSWIGDGSVQVEPDQTAFGAGEVVTLTAVAGLSHIFTGWQDQTNDIIFSTNLTTTITITENRSILAIFTPNTVALTLVLSDPHTLTWDNYGDTCTYDMHAGADPWGILPVRGDGDDLLVNFYDISADLADPASNTFYYVTVVSCVPDVTYNRSNTIGEFSFVIVPGQ